MTPVPSSSKVAEQCRSTKAVIILVRHPPTKLNEQGKVRAQLDPPVPPEGVKVAKTTAAHFKGVKVDKIYADDTKRTRLMADEIAKVTGAPVVLTKKLRTWNLGNFAGQDVKKVEAQIRRYMLKDFNKPVPGGESFQDFVGQLLQFVAPFWDTKKTVVFVTHGRDIMTLKAWDAADGADAPQDLAGDDLSPEPDVIEPGGIAIIGADQHFKVIKHD